MSPLLPRLTRAVATVLALAVFRSDTFAQTPPPSDWDDYVLGFLDSYFHNNPTFAVSAGRHEFDGRLPDWSEKGLEAWKTKLHLVRRIVASFNLDAADTARRFERDYLAARIDRDLFWLELADWPHRNPEYYAGSLDPNVYVTHEYAPLPQRMRAFTRYATNLPVALAQMRANLHTPMPKAYAQIAQGRFGGLADYLKTDVPTVFASVSDSGLHREFEKANAGAIGALQETAAWFAAEQKRGTDAYALGPKLFSEMLKMTEGVDVPLDTLEAWGRRDLERNFAALREACGQFAPGKDLAACMSAMEAHKSSLPPVEEARRQLDSLEAFVRAKSLVSIPGEERALVQLAPPYNRFNFAYIDIPGTYEKGLPSTYYIAPPDPAWPKEKQAAYVPGAADLLFASVHEVWPGHFLHFLHSHRVRSPIGRLFVGYAFAEGWAHYAEEMMWEAGLGAGNPEIHLGQIANALLRDVRYLSAIGLHTGGMTIAESEQLFKEKAFKDSGGAEQQALRGAYDPGYLNYTLGKLMIRRLRDDWTSTRGGRKAWREFHDQFLSFGGPPIPLVRKAMLGTSRGVL
jgi:Bacterial protein of unknown function (DUF885)